jgi:hypothetical protein
MVTQTHSPFETLARVIEHLDADGRSVRRTEAAAGDGGAESLRATVDVSVPGPTATGSGGVEPVDASIDDGLSIVCRAPSFPDPGESLPPGYPPVSVTPTGVAADADEGGVVVTVSVTVDAGAAEHRGGESVRDAVDADGTDGPAGAESRTDVPRDGGASAPGDDPEPDGAPLSAVRDESVPPYDDTPYLRRLYGACDTFAEMSERIGMDVSAETVRRYMIEAGVHSPTSYGTADPDGAETAATDPDTEDDAQSASAGSQDGGSETADDRDVSRTDDAGETDPLPDEQLVADGFGLPEALTLREVADAVVDARTVHEVQRDIGLNYERTRQLLTQLNVLDLVVGRVSAASDRAVTVEAVADRIRQSTRDTQ